MQVMFYPCCVQPYSDTIAVLLLKTKGFSPRWQRDLYLGNLRMLNFTFSFFLLVTLKKNHILWPAVLVSTRMKRLYQFQLIFTAQCRLPPQNLLSKLSYRTTSLLCYFIVGQSISLITRLPQCLIEYLRSFGVNSSVNYVLIAALLMDQQILVDDWNNRNQLPFFFEWRLGRRLVPDGLAPKDYLLLKRLAILIFEDGLGVSGLHKDHRFAESLILLLVAVFEFLHIDSLLYSFHQLQFIMISAVFPMFVLAQDRWAQAQVQKPLLYDRFCSYVDLTPIPDIDFVSAQTTYNLSKQLFPNNFIRNFLVSNNFYSFTSDTNFVILASFLIVLMASAVFVPILGYCLDCLKIRCCKKQRYSKCQLNCTKFSLIGAALLTTLIAISMLFRVTNSKSISSNSMCALYSLRFTLSTGFVAINSTSFFVGYDSLFDQISNHQLSFSLPLTQTIAELSPFYTGLTVGKTSSLASLPAVYTTAINPIYLTFSNPQTSIFKQKLLGNQASDLILGSLYKNLNSIQSKIQSNANNILTRLTSSNTALPISLYLSQGKTNYQQFKKQQSTIIDKILPKFQSIGQGTTFLIIFTPLIASLLIILNFFMTLTVNFSTPLKMVGHNRTYSRCLCKLISILNVVVTAAFVVTLGSLPVITHTCTIANDLTFDGLLFDQVFTFLGSQKYGEVIKPCLFGSSNSMASSFNPTLGKFVEDLSNFTQQGYSYRWKYNSKVIPSLYDNATFQLQKIKMNIVYDVQSTKAYQQLRQLTKYSKCDAWLPDSQIINYQVTCPNLLTLAKSKCENLSSASSCPRGCYGFTNYQRLFERSDFKQLIDSRINSICPGQTELRDSLIEVVQKWDKVRVPAVQKTISDINTLKNSNPFTTSNAQFADKVQQKLAGFSSTFGTYFFKNQTGLLYGTSCQAVLDNFFFLKRSICNSTLAQMTYLSICLGICCFMQLFVTCIWLQLDKRQESAEQQYLYVDSNPNEVAVVQNFK